MVDDMLGIIKIYSELFKSDEMFLVGYLMACGGERLLWNNIEESLKLIEHNPEFWLSIVKDSLRVQKEAFNKREKEVRELLRRKLEERGAKIPDWLKKEERQ